MADPLTERHHSDLLAHLEHISQALAHIAERIENAIPKRPQRVTLSVSGTMDAHTLRTRGYRHNRIWTAAALTLTVHNTTGIITAYQLAAGWNNTDLDDETRLYNASAAANIIIELTDYDN